MKTEPFLYNKLSFLSLLGCVIPVLAPISSSLAAPPITIRASLSSTGAEGNSSSNIPSITPNGRFVAFVSYADNLVPGDTNSSPDVFVRDLKTKETQRVSVSSEGVEGNNYSNSAPSISADGRYVAFKSEATNLVAGDTNGFPDLFVRDLKKGETQRVSVSSEEVEANYGGGTNSPSISANGALVVFNSLASNLVAGDTNETYDVFVRDLKMGETRRVSVSSEGTEGNAASIGISVDISANGRFVAFSSEASNLVEGDTNGIEDVFVHDLKTGVAQRVSVNSAGEEASSSKYDPSSNCGGGSYRLRSYSPSLSANGRFVSFSSNVCNLVEGDTNDDFVYEGNDIFVHDLNTGETKLVSVDSSGGQIDLSEGSDISGNGRFVVFRSSYGGYLNLNYFITSNIVLHDLKTGTTQIVSVGNGQENENYDYGIGAYYPSISATGRFISFSSDATNMVAEDKNNAEDVFVRRMW
jgi:Tol biopolymer transport system component